MIIEIERLRGVWQGIDAEVFCDNVSEYLSKMSNLTVAMRNMSNAINTINNGFEVYDETFGSKLKVEARNYEE